MTRLDVVFLSHYTFTIQKMNNDDEKLKNAISETILELRNEFKMSRNELAQNLGVNPNSLYFIEKGGNRKRDGEIHFVQHLPSLPTLIRIAFVFQMDIHELMARITSRLGRDIHEYNPSVKRVN